MEWQMATRAQPYFIYKMTQSITSGTAESEQTKVIVELAREVTNLNKKMLELGIFKDKYYFDRTWTEIN
jgi:hypothetical protein